MQGQPIDSRSNLFSLGAMFYEMVTERKAFDRDDIESLRLSIIESTPNATDPRESEGASGAQRSDHEGDGEGSGRALSDGQGTAGRSGKVQGVEIAGGEEAEAAKGTMAPRRRKRRRNRSSSQARPKAPASSGSPRASSKPAPGFALRHGSEVRIGEVLRLKEGWLAQSSWPIGSWSRTETWRWQPRKLPRLPRVSVVRCGTMIGAFVPTTRRSSTFPTTFISFQREGDD